MEATSKQISCAKLEKAHTLLSYISKIKEYDAPCLKASIRNFAILLTDLDKAIKVEAITNIRYTFSIAERINAFSVSEVSVNKLLSPILGAIQAQYGKESNQYEFVNSMVETINGTKIIKLPRNIDNKTNREEISMSENSFLSTTQHFKKLVYTISEYKDYKSPNANLEIENLEQFAGKLSVINSKVSRLLDKLTIAKTNKKELYSKLYDCADRIKECVKIQYGVNSDEFKLIKSLII